MFIVGLLIGFIWLLVSRAILAIVLLAIFIFVVVLEWMEQYPLYSISFFYSIVGLHESC